MDIDSDESFEDWLNRRQDDLAASIGGEFVGQSEFAEMVQEDVESNEQDTAGDEDSA